MMTIREWLKDISENHKAELVDGEIVLIPIKGGDN